MDQIHKRFTDDQVKNLFKGYCQGLLDRNEIENILSIGKARFFALLRQYRQDPEGFVNGKIKYPEMAKKSAHLFEGTGYSIEPGKAVESSSSVKGEDSRRRDWNVRSRHAYNH